MWVSSGRDFERTEGDGQGGGLLMALSSDDRQRLTTRCQAVLAGRCMAPITTKEKRLIAQGSPEILDLAADMPEKSVSPWDLVVVCEDLRAVDEAHVDAPSVQVVIQHCLCSHPLPSI